MGTAPPTEQQILEAVEEHLEELILQVLELHLGELPSFVSLLTHARITWDKDTLFLSWKDTLIFQATVRFDISRNGTTLVTPVIDGKIYA